MIKGEEHQEELLRIYHASAPSEPVLNIVKIARCLGISAELIDLGYSGFPTEVLRAQVSSGKGAAVWDAGSLSELIGLEDWRLIASDLVASDLDVLILATGKDDSQSGILRVLSQGGVTRVCPAGHPDSVSFPATSRSLNAELSGHHYARSRCDALALELSGGHGIEIVMEFGHGVASFVSLRSGGSHAFVWSTFSVFDVDRPLKFESEFEEAVAEYIPAIIFLRSGFGDRCWHSPRIGADIVIDDPLLEKRYGFIDFPALIGMARELGFHVTVAFIPWNHWRTRKGSIRVFLDHPESFGICAHGCDHIANEFKVDDYADLLSRSHLAAERMDRHCERTEMEWERIMVCPREDYSIEALQALADSGRFIGLVNTGCIPRNLDSNRVRGSDLLLPVQDAFFGFPIFKRHYWSDISKFAMAVFLGKPAILVEHHAFFKDQHRVLKNFVMQLKATCPTVRWSGLTELACRTFQRRRVAPETLEVRFFTDQFLMDNPDPEPRMVKFQRRFPASAAIESVSVNGAKVPFTKEGGFICFEARLDGNAVASVHLHRRTVPVRSARSWGWTYRMGVAVRRVFSEIRDNWLSRSPTVHRLANLVMKAFGLRSGK